MVMYWKAARLTEWAPAPGAASDALPEGIWLPPPPPLNAHLRRMVVRAEEPVRACGANETSFSTRFKQADGRQPEPQPGNAAGALDEQREHAAVGAEEGGVSATRASASLGTMNQ